MRSDFGIKIQNLSPISFIRAYAVISKSGMNKTSSFTKQNRPSETCSKWRHLKHAFLIGHLMPSVYRSKSSISINLTAGSFYEIEFLFKFLLLHWQKNKPAPLIHFYCTNPDLHARDFLSCSSLQVQL